MYSIEFSATGKNHFNENRGHVSGFTYRDYSIPMHTHDFYEINIILSGSGIHHIEECSVPVKKGNVFVIPPYMAHSYDNCKKLDVFHLLLHADFVKDNYDEASRVPGFGMLFEIEPFIRRNLQEPVFLQLTHAGVESIKPELDALNDKNPLSCREIRKHTAWKLIYTFSMLLSKQLEEKRKITSATHEKEILQVLWFIHNHYSEKLTIKTLCDEVYMSRSTLLRSFHEMCGCSPLEYITAYRKRTAHELLESGEYSKSEVANICGFYDLSHMDKIMKKTSV